MSPPHIKSFLAKARLHRNLIQSQMPGVEITDPQIPNQLTIFDAARHEAGHILAGLSRGTPVFAFVGLTLVGFEGCALVYFENGAQPWDLAVYAVAGAVSQGVKEMSSSDAAMCIPLLQSMPHVAPLKLIDDARSCAAAILEQMAKPRDALCNALQKHGTLERSALLAILRRHGIRCPALPHAYRLEFKTNIGPELRGAIQRASGLSATR